MWFFNFMIVAWDWVYQGQMSFDIMRVTALSESGVFLWHESHLRLTFKVKWFWHYESHMNGCCHQFFNIREGPLSSHEARLSFANIILSSRESYLRKGVFYSHYREVVCYFVFPPSLWHVHFLCILWKDAYVSSFISVWTCLLSFILKYPSSWNVFSRLPLCSFISLFQATNSKIFQVRILFFAFLFVLS